MTIDGVGDLAFGLADVEIERESVAPVLAVALDEVATRRCLCGSKTLGDEIAHREGGCVPIVLQRGSQGAHVPYPAPEVTSREPWDGEGCPSTVAKHAQNAREAGWNVRVQRSRGRAPHATHGRAGALKTWYALVLGRKDGTASAYAVHDGDGWTSVMLWGGARPWFALAGVSDLAEYVEARGAMPDSWYAAIVKRERGKMERTKERAACNRGTHSRAEIIEGGSVFCPVCEQSWPVNQAAPRKTKSGSGEAL